jgi:SWI/SNF-related matrix-associated actin-dependent regulator 1 of chromatin subfamily A
MWLGKTIQAIGVINSTPDARRILIICPASLKLNWKRELEKWLTVPRAIRIVNGGDLCVADDGIVVVNYDILHKHIDALRSIEWDVLIADEAHYAKTRSARRTRMLFGYEPTKKEGKEREPPLRAKRKLLLTGTPIGNRPAEFFPLLHYLDPKAWPSFFPYGKRYCGGYQSRWGWDFTGASNLAELQEKVRSSVMVRRLKKDVLTELPAKRRQVIELPANGAADAIRAELEAYESRADRIISLQVAVELAKASDRPEDYAAAVAALREGMSAAFTEMSALRKATAIAKVPAIIEFARATIESAGKVVLFVHHKEVVRQLAEEFGDDAVALVGDTPMQARQDAVDRFQSDAGCTLFIGSIHAAGVGITLTAASHVLFGELDWVPGNVSQCEDRCHRIGQHDSVTVQHLVLEGSLDATMARRIVEKQDVIDRALDRDAVPVYLAEPVYVASPKAIPPASDDVKPDKLAEAAAKMTAGEREAAHQAIKLLASMCDFAQDLDGAGFNKIDAHCGHSLAQQEHLSAKQAALAARIATKYRRQLPEALVTQMRSVTQHERS